MTLLVEVKKELRRLEEVRKGFEAKAAHTKRMEDRLRQLAVEFTTGLAPAPKATKKPMSAEHRAKISEALKRRFAKN
jgi:hypothetical protein